MLQVDKQKGFSRGAAPQSWAGLAQTGQKEGFVLSHGAKEGFASATAAPVAHLQGFPSVNQR